MSVAKVIHGRVAPEVLDAAAAEVERALIPQFIARPGAQHASWMADRPDGRVLIVMIWADDEAVRASRSADGEARARLAERIGLRIDSVVTLEVVAATETAPTGTAMRRWARATWVEGVVPDLDLSVLHRQTVSDQARSRGFAGSYWLVDREAGNGVALSFWDRPADLHDSKAGSHRRRRRLEQAIGFHVDRIDEYESLGAATAEPVLDMRHLAPPIPAPTHPVGAP